MGYEETVNWHDIFTEKKLLTELTEGRNKKTIKSHDDLNKIVKPLDGFLWKKFKRKPSRGMT